MDVIASNSQQWQSSSRDPAQSLSTQDCTFPGIRRGGV